MKKKTLFLVTLLLAAVTIEAQNITLDEVASGFNDPIDIQNAGDDRLFIAEQAGIIKILNTDGTTNTTPFLNISGLTSSGGESGLLGLTFHPDYTTNGYFYVHYSNNSGDTQISRFSVDGSNPDIADATSEFDILTVIQPFGNHNGGAIAFGPDGFLYIALGDGGSGGDPGNRAQNTTLLLGKLLRIDVDNPSNGNNYGIPADNPFVGSSSQAQEIWAYGLRNPWKFSFDSDNGDIWIGDVGQNAFEEINKAGLSEAGLNYGWRCYEANAPFNTANCPPMGDLTFPIGEYGHSDGFSITGGYVYRGATYTDIHGYYFFADFGTALIGTISPTEVQNNLGTFGGNWSSFGEDVNNELYISSYGGQIFQIQGEEIAGVDDFKNLAVNLSPNPADHFITIETPRDLIKSIEIFNVIGSQVITMDNISTNTQKVNLESLSAGVYLVKVSGDRGQAIKKLVVR